MTLRRAIRPSVAANDVSRAARRALIVRHEPGNSEPTPSGPPAPNGRPSDEYDPLPQTGVLTAPGVGGPPVWTMPGMIPSTPVRPRQRRTTTPRPREIDKDIAGKVIRQAMHENDKSKGIDIPAVGTAASAVQASLYGSDLPSESRGTIAIQIGANGTVTGVKVVSMVGGTSDQWERAAQAAVASLKAQRLSLPDAYKKGMIVYLDAQSRSSSSRPGRAAASRATRPRSTCPTSARRSARSCASERATSRSTEPTLRAATRRDTLDHA